MPLKNVHDRQLSRKEAAHFLRRSVSTLEKWASQKKYLKYVLVGGRAEYKMSDLLEFKKGKQTF